jgi:hypothetical protein
MLSNAASPRWDTGAGVGAAELGAAERGRKSLESGPAVDHLQTNAHLQKRHKAVKPCAAKSGRPDSNRGPPAPKAGALPDCATPRSCCAAVRYTTHSNLPHLKLSQNLTRNESVQRPELAIALSPSRCSRCGAPACAAAQPVE